MIQCLIAAVVAALAALIWYVFFKNHIPDAAPVVGGLWACCYVLILVICWAFGKGLAWHDQRGGS